MRTIESTFESPAVEQTAETLRPSVPQTPEIAPALAAVPMPPGAARLTEPSDEEIRLRAYFISEDRRRFALPGDADSDWREAKQQLLSESGELSRGSTITTLPAVVTSAETEVAPIEEGQPASHEAYRKAEPGGELPPLTESVFESPVEPAVEQTAETLRPSVPQTPEIAPALAAVPMPPEAARLTEPSDEEIRLRAYFISEDRRRFALPGDADSDWREAKQQLLSESAELSGRSTITTEEPSEIPARGEEIALPVVVTSIETEVAPIEEVQPALHEACRQAEPDGELPPLTESTFESPAVEQTAETLRPSVPQTTKIAPALAAVPMPPEAARLTKPWDEEILEIPAGTEEIAQPTVVASTETEVAPIEEGQPVSHEAYKAEPGDELPPLTEPVFESPVGPNGEQTAETLQASVPQTTEIAPALAAVPMPLEGARLETTQMPTAPVNKPLVTAVAKSQSSGTMQTFVQLTFSFEIAAMQLTPTFKIGVLKVRPISKIVTMRLAPSQQAQLEVGFKIAKIQPVGETLGTIRVTPSQQQRPMMGSPSFMAAGLQLVPNVEATPIQLMPSQQGQAAVFVTVPCRITTIEFSPLLEIASVVLNSSSKQVLVQGGAGASPAEGPLVFEIADLQLSEGGNTGMIQLNLLGESPTDNARRRARDPRHYQNAEPMVHENPLTSL